MQPREYTLRAKGWVRVVSGAQSLISVYLIAMWGADVLRQAVRVRKAAFSSSSWDGLRSETWKRGQSPLFQ